MRNSQRSHEGYLLIDARESPGMGPRGAPFGSGSVNELPIYTCSHCQRGVVVNPLRTRDRAYCPKCDHVICDQCEAVRVASGGACKPFAQIADEVCEAAVTAEQRSRSSILILPGGA